MESKYRGPKSQAKNQTVPIAVDDPRLNWLKIGQTRARIGAEIEIVGLDGKSLVMGGTSLTSGGSGIVTQTPDPVPVIIPPINNKPPAVYPGGSGPFVIVPTDPTSVTATWGTLSGSTFTAGNGDDLQVQFTFDTTLTANKTMSSFSVQLTSGGSTYNSQTFPLDSTQTTQTVVITKAINISMFNIFTTALTSVCVKVNDPFNNTSNVICAATVPTYVLNLNAPTISVANANNGYIVTVTNTSEMAKGAFDAIDIWEIESTASTAPAVTYAADGVTPTNYSRVYFNKINPATIISPNLNKRWVIARFSSASGIYTAFSTAYAATPISPVTVDNTPPNESTVTSSVWSGDNIVISYTINDATATRFLVQLTSPNSSVGYFYFYPVGSGTSQTATITKTDLFNQFGDYFSSFSGVFKSIDSADNRSAGVNFTVSTRANPLSGVTPTATAVSISNGYTVNFNLPTAAAYGEVYQKATTWGSITTPIDYYTATFSSGGTSGGNTLLVNTIKDNNNNVISTAIPTGYFITGTGIPANTFISAVSGTTTQTLTLSTYDSTGGVIASNLTVQAAGTYTITALVYSGNGPATIPLQLYGNEYIIVRYYDSWHNASNVSAETIVKPINPAVVDNTVPSTPTVTSTAQGNNTITLNVATTDATTKGYRVRYKKSTDTLYTTDIVAPISAFSAGTSTTSYTINNLISGTTYNISAAGYNQYNGVGSYSTDINVSTATPTVSVVTGLTLTASTYGLTASWTAPASPTTPVSQYKVELYNSSNTLLLTDYTFSTNYSVSGLSASTTYYVKVYTQDVYGKLSAAVTSSNLTLNGSGQTTDGLAPSASPAATVNPLYGAIEVKWTGLTVGARSTTANPDPVIYEVHVSTTTGFTPDRVGTTTLALKTAGTFAVIKTLPGTSTALTYGTTYYVKIVATDFDGAAAAGTQGSAAPLTISNTDITANTITANQIQAGTITSNEINSNSLLVSKLFAVGTTTDTYAIKIDATANTVKFYAGTGTYQNSNTGFYLDTTGKFSIKDKLWIDGSVANTSVNATTSGSTAANSYTIVVTSATGIVAGMYVTSAAGIASPTLVTGVNGTTITLSQKTTAIIATGTTITFTSTPTLTMNGAINAQSGVFHGAISAGDMKLGAAVNSTNNGIYINTNNYWYDTGNFAVGASNNGIAWDGTNFNITGGLTAARGAFTGPLLIGGNGYIMAASSATITNVTASAGNVVYTTSAAHGFTVGQTVTIVGVVPGAYNLTNQTITAVTTVSPFTFTIANAATGTYSYGGTAMITSGASSRIQIASSAITAYDAGGNATTQIVSNAANGANTFITSNAKIADWTISASKIESTLVTGITKYTGLSASNTSYAFWAGATAATNTDNSAPFSVTPLGAVKASNIAISGGNLDIGGTSVSTTATATLGATTLTVASFTGITSGMTVFGAGIAAGTTVTATPTTTSVAISAATTSALSTTPVYFVSSSGAHITSAGDLYASNANLQGRITASSGSFTGNIQLGASGSLYSGTISAGALSGLGFIINQNGLLFQNAGGSAITQITASNGQFITTSANIGGWTINSSQISKTGLTGGGNILLDSTNGNISVSNTNVASYTAGINGTTTATTSNAFWAGTGGATGDSTTNGFRVTLGGKLYARNADITGTITVATAGTASTKNIITIDAVKDWISLGDAAGTAYLVTRNNNIYLTSPAPTTTMPWSSSSGNPTSTDTSSPTGTPYLAAGSSFKNSYGTTVNGIGIYTGNWDYFSAASGTAASAASSPFITATTTGLQLSANADIGMLMEGGGSTIFPNNPGLLIYTSKETTAPFKPTTAYGAWATFEPNKIALSATSSTFLAIYGTNATSLPTGATTNSIFIQANAARDRNVSKLSEYTGGVSVTDGFDSAYRAASKIAVTSTGVRLSGAPFIGDMNVNASYTGTKGTFVGLSADYMKYYDSFYTGNTNGYLNIPGLGPLPRSRALVEDPSTGEMKLGFAIYYQDTSISNIPPTATSGYVGDLWVQY